MKKIFSFFILFKYILSFNEPNPYFSENISNDGGGNPYEIPDDGKNEFPCGCDLTENTCDYQCCCDDDCPENIRNYWKEKQKCTNEVNTLNFFNYKCINEKLIAFNHPRKGTDELKESVKNKKCFGNDNSPKMKEIYKNLNDIIKKEDDKGKEKLDKIYSDYIEDKILNTFNFDYTDGNFIRSMTNRKFGLISAEADGFNYFITDNIFTIYSKGLYGECVPGRKIQFFENIRNSECLMTLKDSEIQNYCNSILNLKIAEKQVKISSYYIIRSNGILSDKINETQNFENLCNSNYYPVEINFLIKSTNGKNIEEVNVECILNRTEETSIQFLSTLSVNFYNNTIFLFSGNPGYLLNHPLLIVSSDNHLYRNGYVMVGKDKDGKCQIYSGVSQEFEYYLYGIDSPILFGQDYNYICSFNYNDLNNNPSEYFKNLLLFNKAINIRHIGIYGSFYKQTRIPVNYSDDFINLVEGENIDFNNSKKCNDPLFPFPQKIILNIYVGKENDYYIVIDAKYDIIYNCFNKNSSNNLIFATKYHYIEKGKTKDNILLKNPDLPTILPKLPKDLLDPIKDINVNI